MHHYDYEHKSFTLDCQTYESEMQHLEFSLSKRVKLLSAVNSGL